MNSLVRVIARRLDLGLRKRILVVDDEPLIGRSLRRAFSADDVEVTTNGHEALAVLRDATFDVIFCDLTMPGMNGMDVFERIRTDHPELASRVVFMTGDSFSPSARGFLDGLTNLRIDKPFDIENVRNLVLQLTGNG